MVKYTMGIPFPRRKLKFILLVITAYAFLLILFYEIRASNTEGKSTYLDDSETIACPVYQIPSKAGINTTELFQEPIKCQQHEPSNSSCLFAHKFFKYDFNEWKCGDDVVGEVLKICWYVQEKNRYTCNPSQCGNHRVYVHRFNSKLGKLVAIKMSYNRKTNLSGRMTVLAIQSLKEGFPFLYLSCGKDIKRMQLLVLEPSILLYHNDAEINKFNKININLLFIDSLSRAHFYRSLKKTVSYLSWLNSESSLAEVLDYEMFQSIHGHTTENILGLMTGKIFPKNVTDEEKEISKPEFPAMLKFVKGHGYETLYQENMCWKGHWGLNSDLGSFEEWEPFYRKLNEESFIDDTGK
jgi:Protein of unknown function (DUF229).